MAGSPPKPDAMQQLFEKLDTQVSGFQHKAALKTCAESESGC